MLRKDGTIRDVEAVVSNQTDRPSVAGYVSNIRDITERKKFEALLAHRALHDPLTGLANRQLILDRAQQMLVRARRSGAPVAALFIDLDNFKDSNDSLGHGAGDQVAANGGGTPARHSAVGRHRRATRRGRVRHSGRGGLFARGPGDDRRAGPRGAQAGLPHPGDRRHDDHDLGEHRDRRGRSPVGRGSPAGRRHRSLPGQGSGPGPVRPLRALHAVGGQGTARPQVGPGVGARRRRVHAGLPPDLRSRRDPDPRCRSAPSVAAPHQGHHRARRLHPGARGERPHRRRRPVGAQRVLPGGRRLAPPGARRQHLGERLHAAARVGPAPRRRPRRARPPTTSIPTC